MPITIKNVSEMENEQSMVSPAKNGHVFNYEGCDITFSTGESLMINATQMAKPFGKSKTPTNWLKNQSTKEFLSEYSGIRKIRPLDLVRVINGDNGGTWMHEDVALEFARWLSPKFAIWCNDRIKELGKYGFTATPETLENIVNNPDLLISLATQLKEERRQKAELEAKNLHQQELIEAQAEEIQSSAPKVKYYDETLQSVNTLTTTQVAKQLGMDAEKLHLKLRDAGLIYKQSSMWMLKSPYDNWRMHAVRTMTYTRSDGSIGTRSQTVWTERGRYFITVLHQCGYDIKLAIRTIQAKKN